MFKYSALKNLLRLSIRSYFRWRLKSELNQLGTGFVIIVVLFRYKTGSKPVLCRIFWIPNRFCDIFFNTKLVPNRFRSVWNQFHLVLVLILNVRFGTERSIIEPFQPAGTTEIRTSKSSDFGAVLYCMGFRAFRFFGLFYCLPWLQFF